MREGRPSLTRSRSLSPTVDNPPVLAIPPSPLLTHSSLSHLVTLQVSCGCLLCTERTVLWGYAKGHTQPGFEGSRGDSMCLSVIVTQVAQEKNTNWACRNKEERRTSSGVRGTPCRGSRLLLCQVPVVPETRRAGKCRKSDLQANRQRQLFLTSKWQTIRTKSVPETVAHIYKLSSWKRVRGTGSSRPLLAS